MHRRTFERAMERIYRAEEIVEWHSDPLLDRNQAEANFR
jgi:hypothetical protein